jgi:hypothetical protein
MMPSMTTTLRARDGGYDFELALETDRLLPGRLVDGQLTIGSADGGAFRGARVTLVGTETWRHDRTTTDAEGHTRTETVTSHEDLPHVPIAVLDATSLAAGETRVVAFQVPVPSLGPATFEGTELSVAWELRVNLDVGGLDPNVTLPVRVLQPTALLRAGVVDVAEFALYDEAEVAADDLRGRIRLEPVPLCVGIPFRGTVTMDAGDARTVQEVRLELRIRAEATVSGGRDETIVLWSGRLADPGAFGGGAATYAFEGTIDDRSLPTVQTPHGRSEATFHVVIATAWARDPHLVRDVAICSTTEV